MENRRPTVNRYQKKKIGRARSAKRATIERRKSTRESGRPKRKLRAQKQLKKRRW